MQVGDFMTEKEMWRGVKDNDVRADGLYFYGVKTTGIYCRPSCKSRLPKKENVLYFNNKDKAQEHGFRPCKRCRPDLIHFNPDEKLTMTVLKIIEKYYWDDERISAELNNLGISSHRLNEVFKKKFNMTIRQCGINYRIDKAKELLESTDDTAVDIGFAVGFNTTSTYYKHFNEKVGQSPSSYREQFRGE